MPTGATPRRSRDMLARLRDRRLVGCILLGAGVGGALFATLAKVRATPQELTPTVTLVWALVSVALLSVGASLWLLSRSPLAVRRALAAAGAGLALTLLTTVAAHPAHWRTIAGHPDNAPSSFYSTTTVSALLDRLVGYADGRRILGLYFSNHYESSVIVPLTNGPAGSTGGEIISVLAGGQATIVQTKLSPGVAQADGVDPAQIDPQVLSNIANEVASGQGLSDRDEVRLQIQNRDDSTTIEVMTRKGGADQPWRYFDLAGNALQ